jgi:aspartate/methionine/tyrosine aminotransferase
MRYRRLPIEVESPEELGYQTIRNNLSESSYRDMTLAELGIDTDVSGLLLQYGDHRGLPELRDAVADSASALGADDVLVTAGAASALFIAHTAVLAPGDHALVVRPNYATNVETPRAIGADVEYLDLQFEDGWRLDAARVQAGLRDSTKLVSVSLPHNPTGQSMSSAELAELINVIERHPTARLLVDETYRDLAYVEPLPPVAALSERTIGVSSMSKSYGLPGLRIGWLTTRDPGLMETFLAAKEQILITGSTIDEALAARVLARKEPLIGQVRKTVRTHLSAVQEFIAAQSVFEWVEPTAGVVGFPRICSDQHVDVDQFYRSLLSDHGTYVGPGHWFEQERRYFRVGFGWPTTQELRNGLEGLLAAAKSSTDLRARGDH